MRRLVAGLVAAVAFAVPTAAQAHYIDWTRGYQIASGHAASRGYHEYWTSHVVGSHTRRYKFTDWFDSNPQGGVLCVDVVHSGGITLSQRNC